MKIPIIKNIDSLEKAIPLFNKLSNEYIYHLITIERSRLAFGSYKTGKYLNEIDSLSGQSHFKFGSAFAAYALAYQANFYSPGNVKKPLILAQEALKYFTELNDTSGIFFSDLLNAYAYSGYLGYLSFYEFGTLRENLKDSINQAHGKTIQQFLESASNIASTHNSANYMVPLLYNKALILSRTSNLKSNTIELKKYLNDGIKLIEKNPEMKYKLSSFYNLYSIILDHEDSVHKCIDYYRKAYENIAHQESDLNYAIYSNLGVEFSFIDRIDSSNFYYLKALDGIKKNADGEPRMELVIYNHLAINYQKLNQFDLALKYKTNAFDKLQKINEESLMNAFNSVRDFDKMKIQEANELKLTMDKEKVTSKLFVSTIGIISSLLIIIILIILLIRLRMANKEIIRMHRTREKFLTIVAHDLKSPLTSYHGLASSISFLLKEKNYAQIEKIANRIDTSSIKLQSMLKNLFEWSISEQQKLQFNNTEFPFNDPIIELLPLYEEIAITKQVMIQTNFQYNGTIVTDRNYMATILRNLIDNAIKYSVLDAIIMIETSKNENLITFRISHPTNIKIETFNHILKLFTSEDTTLPGENGIGLGLILIRDFTKKMNAKVDLTLIDSIIQFQIKFPARI